MVYEKMVKPVYSMIAAGILLAVSCLVFAVINPASKSIDILNLVFLILQAGFGIAIMIVSLKVTHKFFHIFIGLVFLFWSIITILINVLLPYTEKELWPLYGVAAAIAMFISGYKKYGSIKFGYLVPSIFFFGFLRDGGGKSDIVCNGFDPFNNKNLKHFIACFSILNKIIGISLYLYN